MPATLKPSIASGRTGAIAVASRPSAEQRDRQQVAAAQRVVVARRQQRAGQHPAAEGGHEQGEAGAAAAELVGASTSSATLVAPATSITAPEVSTSERTSGSFRTPSQVRGQRRRVLVARAAAGETWPRRRVISTAEAAKVTALSAEHQLGLGDEQQAGGDGGADQLADLAHGAEEAVGGVQATRG